MTVAFAVCLCTLAYGSGVLLGRIREDARKTHPRTPRRAPTEGGGEGVGRISLLYQSL